MNSKIYIGIDPGVVTGLAVWESVVKRFSLIFSKGIIESMLAVLLYKKSHGAENIIVRIENPNLRKWYGPNAHQKQQGAGSIKRDYSIWVEFLQHHSIPCQEVNPKHVLTKMNTKAFASLTGWPGKTNEHSRDASMLVYGL